MAPLQESLPHLSPQTLSKAQVDKVVKELSVRFPLLAEPRSAGRRLVSPISETTSLQRKALASNGEERAFGPSSSWIIRP